MSDTKREPKRYRLLPHMHPSAPIFLQVGPTEQVHMNRLVDWMPFLETVIVDEDGNSKEIRFKLGAKSIYVDEQVKQGFPKNLPYTAAEYRALRFKFGELITSNAIAQDYLDAMPQNTSFKGSSPEGLKAAFESFIPSQETKKQNAEFKLRLKAANRVNELTLDQVNDYLTRINGAFYELPTEIEEAQMQLVGLMDDSIEVVNLILKDEKEFTFDEQTELLVAKLTRAGILSFDAVPNAISKKRNGQWVTLRTINSAETTADDRVEYFVNFLTSEDGKSMLADLKTEEKKLEKPSAKKDDKIIA